MGAKITGEEEVPSQDGRGTVLNCSKGVNLGTKILSVTKLSQNSPELFSNQALTLGASMFISALSNFSKTLHQNPPNLDISSSSSSSAITQGMSDHAGLPSARILVDQFSQNPLVSDVSS